MIIKNNTNGNIIISDMKQQGETDFGITLGPGAQLSVLDGEAGASRDLKTYVDAGQIIILSQGEAGVLGVATDDQVGATAHAQGTDQTLDLGGVNEVAVADVKDAVDTKHDGTLQAVKDTVPVEADAVVTVVADAGAVSVGYDQTEVQAIVDLANDLKAKYNDAVGLINELKGIIDTMNT